MADKTLTATTTSSKPKDEIKIATQPALKAEPDVAVRSYVSSKGYSGTVDWDGEKVDVGGVPITPRYVRDGMAYAPRSQVDEAVGIMEKRNGIMGSSAVMGETEKKFGTDIKKTLRELLDRKEFSYDPDADPAYKAYKRQYESAAEAAYRSVLNKNNTSEYGASGAVLSEAMAKRDAYLRELADTVPVLEQNAFKRYSAETDRMSDNLDALVSLASDYYDRLYKADLDAAARINEAGRLEREEKQRWENNEQNRIKNMQSEREFERQRENDYYTNELKKQQLERGEIDSEYYGAQVSADLLETRLANEKTGLSNAITRGFFVSQDEAALPWLGNYRRSDGSYSITPWEAQAKYEFEVAYAKKHAEMLAQWGM